MCSQCKDFCLLPKFFQVFYIFMKKKKTNYKWFCTLNFYLKER